MTKEKKKMSKFGKVWIIVCVVAVVLGLLLATLGPIGREMSYYTNHEHDDWCYYSNPGSDALYLDCGPSYYSNAFTYAMGNDNYMWYVVFGFGALVAANVVMLIIFAVRKANAKKAEEVSTIASIPTGEDEQVVLQRILKPILPYFLIVLSIVSSLYAIIQMIDRPRYIDDMIPVLIISIIVLVVGFLLLKLATVLTVTTKRVIVKAPLGRRLSLPINRISAVGTGPFHYLSITSTAGIAGQIRLVFVPKYVEVYDTINTLLNQVK